MFFRTISARASVISPTVFTMFVLMALVTTFATTPLLDVLLGQRGFADAPSSDESSNHAPRTSG